MAFAQCVIDRPSDIVGEPFSTKLIEELKLAHAIVMPVEALPNFRCSIVNFRGRSTKEHLGSINVVVERVDMGVLYTRQPQDPRTLPLRVLDPEVKRRPSDRNTASNQTLAQIDEKIVKKSLGIGLVYEPVENSTTL
jgi:hypothetical protein